METPLRISSLYKACLAIILINAGDGVVSSVFSPFLDTNGYSLSSIGFVTSLFSALSLVSRVPAGLAYQPHRARKMMFVACGVFAITLPLYSLAADPWMLIAVRAVGGFSYGAAGTLNLTIFLGCLSTSSNRARSMALYATAQSAGFAIGNSAGGGLVDAFGYQWSFAVAAILPLMAALFTSVEATASGQEKPRAKGSHPVTVWSKVNLVRNGPMLSILLLAFCLNAVHQLLGTFFPLWAVGIGLSLTSIGLLKGLHSVSGVVTRPFSGEATRFASISALTNGGLLLVVLLIYLMTIFDSMLPLVLLFAFLGTARGVVMVGNTISLADEVGDDVDKKGIAAGIFHMAKDVGNIGGPMLGGVMAAQIGVEAMLRVAPAMLLAAYFAVLVATSRGRRKPVPAGPVEGIAPEGDS